MWQSKLSKKLLLSLLLLCFYTLSFSAGKVYLVIGSDTAIWSGMNTSKYQCTYNQALYTDPTMNAYEVMDPAFRANLVDSYGQPMRMTWWMMAGNIFRYATNKNVPLPNIITLYLMKKYHGENVITNGDELSLHYHTFYWSDYDHDGLYYWNQSKTFLECFDDFNVTLAQFLLEENVFPVSFRSGWHYMDNDWQDYLDTRILPYSMHNDYPAKRIEDPEPIDNIFDWSLAPSDFIPYHPDKENYQIPGDGPGWNVRSASFQKTRAADLMDDIFFAANNGTDQVACLWAHLPETDFPENMKMIDSLAHKYSEKYPEVIFQYCTAIEAMQLWRNSNDTNPPVVTFTEELSGEDVYFKIETHELIFQRQPFVAVKDIFEQYTVLSCFTTGENEWQTNIPVSRRILVKAGVAVCDTLGNQTLKYIEYLPDDIFIDNKDAGYVEFEGNWTTSSSYAWGIDSRFAELSVGDSAIVAWSHQIKKSNHYNIFVQMPDISNRAEHIIFTIFNNQKVIDSVEYLDLMPAKDWIYLSTIQAEETDKILVQMNATGKNQAGKILAADVLKISAFVRQKDINVNEAIIDFGSVSVEDSVQFDLKISNLGIEKLDIISLSSANSMVTNNVILPLSIPPMSNIIIPLHFISTETGNAMDTLIIESDDPFEPELKIPAVAEVQKYFKTIDNEDFANYEEFGVWHTSVANIYGPSSRYAPLNANPLASARFFTTLKKKGIYDILEIVPTTVNSTEDALYELKIDGSVVSSFHVDQNEGSGNWVSIVTHVLPADIEIELWISDTGNSTNGLVIRTDAVRFSLLEEITELDESENDKVISTFHLAQNYPNPFNPKTKITYQLPIASNVELNVFDLLGQKITTLVSKSQPVGLYSVEWDGRNSYGRRVASGIYFYKIQANDFIETKKMMYLQ